MPGIIKRARMIFLRSLLSIFSFEEKTLCPALHREGIRGLYRNKGRERYLILVSIDDHERILEQYGNGCWEKTKEKVLSIIRSSIRRCDVLKKHGENHFLLMFKVKDSKNVDSILSRISSCLACEDIIGLKIVVSYRTEKICSDQEPEQILCDWEREA